MDKSKAQVTEGIVSVIVNALLFAVKFWAGIVTGSIALVADAWHTLSDSLTSIFVIFAVKLSTRKADKEHPFGHGRWEQISSIFVAVVLGIIGYDFLRNSITKFNNRESAIFGTLAIIITVVSIAAKELLAQYAFYLARKTGNLVIRADAWHHRSDALSSIVVLVGILFSMFFGEKLWWIDSVLGMIIALMLFYASFEIIKEAITKLLGEEPDQSLVDKIHGEIKKIYGDDLHIHHIHLHNYVLHQEVTLHIRLDKNKTIEEGHKTATVIEETLEKQFNMTATVHVEPLL